MKGQVSIHVIQDKDNSQEILQTVENICAKQHLDRSAIGQRVWTSGMISNMVDAHLGKSATIQESNHGSGVGKEH